MEEFAKRIYTVSDITSEIKDLLEYSFDNIYITGEISNFRAPTSGHYYFTLKDDKAQIKAVMFRNSNMSMKFVPADGMQILGRGRISVYEPQGAYQVILDSMEPAGLGALKQAFDDLKLKLKKEGLFDEARKKKLPILLQSVGVVTSPTGAAIRDFLSVATRRFSNINVIIYPARVQGEGAAKQIVNGIKYFNKEKNVDAIVLTRGGGSFEELFCFSEEKVARAIYASKLPVISAVGHEVDYSISDFVADLRAPTPTAAAELIITHKEDITNKISGHIERLNMLINASILEKKRKVDYCQRLLGAPERMFDNLKIRVDNLTSHLITSAKSNLNSHYARLELGKEALKGNSPELLLTRRKTRLETLTQNLENMMLERLKFNSYRLNELKERLDISNPYSLLKKGYSITYLSGTKQIVRASKEVKEGDLIDVKLSEGSIECKVAKINNM